jgi:hypothetical protein
MALTSVISLDVINVNSSITYNNPSQIESISFSSNSITFSSTAGFTLSKSDTLLYLKYLLAFNSQLFVNFPFISQFSTLSLPVSQFKILILNGPNIIEYFQTSTSSPVSLVYNITYTPGGTATFAARSSPITITLQEFFMCIYMMIQYQTQININ